MKSAAILDLLFYRLTQCGAITGTGNGYSAIFYHSTRLCNRFMEAAILEQQEQQEKVDYKESFPTTPAKLATKRQRISTGSTTSVADQSKQETSFDSLYCCKKSNL